MSVSMALIDGFRCVYVFTGVRTYDASLSFHAHVLSKYASIRSPQAGHFLDTAGSVQQSIWCDEWLIANVAAVLQGVKITHWGRCPAATRWWNLWTVWSCCTILLHTNSSPRSVPRSCVSTHVHGQVLVCFCEAVDLWWFWGAAEQSARSIVFHGFFYCIASSGRR